MSRGKKKVFIRKEDIFENFTAEDKTEERSRERIFYLTF
jgi:hypothetical protein